MKGDQAMKSSRPNLLFEEEDFGFAGILPKLAIEVFSAVREACAGHETTRITDGVAKKMIALRQRWEFHEQVNEFQNRVGAGGFVSMYARKKTDSNGVAPTSWARKYIARQFSF